MEICFNLQYTVQIAYIPRHFKIDLFMVYYYYMFDLSTLHTHLLGHVKILRQKGLWTWKLSKACQGMKEGGASTEEAKNWRGSHAGPHNSHSRLVLYSTPDPVQGFKHTWSSFRLQIFSLGVTDKCINDQHGFWHHNLLLTRQDQGSIEFCLSGTRSEHGVFG